MLEGSGTSGKEILQGKALSIAAKGRERQRERREQ
jgi:hypothetical protein